MLHGCAYCSISRSAVWLQRLSLTKRAVPISKVDTVKPAAYARTVDDTIRLLEGF